MQVPVLAKADSMTVEELREFRRAVRDALEHVRILCSRPTQKTNFSNLCLHSGQLCCSAVERAGSSMSSRVHLEQLSMAGDLLGALRGQEVGFRECITGRECGQH